MNDKPKKKKKEEEFPLSKKLREKLELEEKLIKKKIKVKDYFKTLEMTPKQKKAFERDKRLLEAEKEYFADPKNKRKRWDPDDPIFHKRAKGGAVKRYKGGLMVKPKAAKRGY